MDDYRARFAEGFNDPIIGEMNARTIEEASIAIVGGAAVRVIWAGYRVAAAARVGAEVIRVGEYTLTRTVAGKLVERPYLNSPNVLREIMASGKPVADPGGAVGALRWDVQGGWGKSAGTWQLVVEPQSKTVLHWMFKSAPKGAP